MKLQFIARALFLVLLASISNICIAEELKININPLLDYHQQIKDLKKECFNAGFPEECEKRLKTLNDEYAKLTKYCMKNQNDFRCDSISKRRAEQIDPLEELCARDPYATKCVNKRERQKMSILMTAKYCKTRPESSRCKPKPPKKKKEPYLVSFCRNNPEKKMCLKYIEAERLRKDPFYKEDQANLF
jgi:hypothetical protein